MGIEPDNESRSFIHDSALLIDGQYYIGISPSSEMTYVEPRHRGKGLSIQLIKLLLQESKNIGLKRLFFTPENSSFGKYLVDKSNLGFYHWSPNCLVNNP